MKRGWLLSVALCGLTAAAQERPSEEAMFGGSAEAAVDAGAAPADRPSEDSLFGGGRSLSQTVREAVSASGADGGSPDRDSSQLGGVALHSRFDTDEEKTDPLKIGGTLYLRGQASLSEHTGFDRQSFTLPSLLDVFMDARPNDRVRGMAVGRLRYDATTSATASSLFSLTSQTVAAPASNPAIYLDQLWLRFDIARTVFVTVGRQKVRWGTARLWTPSDFLNSVRRDPLQPFDLRLGSNLVKFHLPIESLGWNFYGYGLFDNVNPANTLGQIGGALRAEFVLPKLGTEIGMGGIWVRGARPRYTLDISSPLGPVDVYGEFAFRDGQDFSLWKVNGTVDPASPITASFENYHPDGIQVQAVGGVAWTFNYTDKNTAVLGAEYFYNPVGSSTPVLYPWLLYKGQFNPFYAGKHYAGFFLLFAGLPDLTWVTLNLTNLVNFSDLSGTVRLDAFFRVLTYLQVEVFAAANYGTRGGEFHFSLDLPPLPQGDGTFTPEVHVPAPIGSFGIGLRVSI